MFNFYIFGLIFLTFKGLSKIASSKGTDASAGLVADGSCQTFGRACCKYVKTRVSIDVNFFVSQILNNQ